jgi:hypothetical protein
LAQRQNIHIGTFADKGQTFKWGRGDMNFINYISTCWNVQKRSSIGGYYQAYKWRYQHQVGQVLRRDAKWLFLETRNSIRSVPDAEINKNN